MIEHALALLADAFAGDAAALDELRARWRDLAADERAALTPLAQLAAERFRPTEARDAASPTAAPPRDAGVAPAADSAAAGASPAGVSPAAARATGAKPEALLSLLGLAAFRPGQREAVQAALDGRDALVV
ncbi:MAG TPA: ATP-dependent DNA helicase RecQ, partial [Solirubrobacter sp.]|nr:ATP-dependent DNA helicase RecQ [Solirubrobacter sp.]